MTPHLLLIGGGTMQLPALEYAHQLGAKVLCFDGNPDAPARTLADWFTVADIKDKDLCLEKAREHRLDGVVTVGTDFSTTVAWIAGHLGLAGTSYDAALLAKDKGLMRARFAGLGVSSPRFQVVSTQDLGNLTLGVPLPVVVKPTDNMGARGVQLVSKPDELVPAVSEALGYSAASRAIIEEYIDGPEFSLDAIVRDGRVYRCGFADRTIVFPPSFVEIGHTFPSTASAEVQEAVWKEFEKGIAALGLTWGAAKGDIKYSPTRGPVIGEIASRLSGGYMSGWTYPLSSGRSAVLWAVETALGRPLSPQPDETHLPVVERAWVGFPGRIKSVRGVDAARQLPGVREIFLTVSPGKDTVFPRNNVEKLGNLLVSGPTSREADENARRARNAVVFEYEPAYPATDRFLEGNGPEPWWFPEARSKGPQTPENWLALGRKDGWLDLYGNTLEDLTAILEAEGYQPLTQSARFWRSFLVGGLSGARYAAASV